MVLIEELPEAAPAVPPHEEAATLRHADSPKSTEDWVEVDHQDAASPRAPESAAAPQEEAAAPEEVEGPEVVQVGQPRQHLPDLATALHYWQGSGLTRPYRPLPPADKTCPC